MHGEEEARTEIEKVVGGARRGEAGKVNTRISVKYET